MSSGHGRNRKLALGRCLSFQVAPTLYLMFILYAQAIPCPFIDTFVPCVSQPVIIPTTRGDMSGGRACSSVNLASSPLDERDENAQT